jgi:lysozyme|tara:strand:- start:1139 stop:1564 length:426 start_codon:yes stop_codon:yes gene_type:complete
MNLKTFRAEIKRDEGYRATPYKCTSGRTTIGVGWNLDARGLPDHIIEMLLDISISDTQESLDKSVPGWRDMPDEAQRGLANLTFCVGPAGVLKFTKMLGALEGGDYETAACEVMDSLFALQTGERAERIAKLFRKANLKGE